MQDIADEALKASAMQASTIWFDPNFQAQLRSGELTPEQASQPMRMQDIDLFVGSTAGVDPLGPRPCCAC